MHLVNHLVHTLLSGISTHDSIIPLLKAESRLHLGKHRILGPRKDTAVLHLVVDVLLQVNVYCDQSVHIIRRPSKQMQSPLIGFGPHQDENLRDFLLLDLPKISASDRCSDLSVVGTPLEKIHFQMSRHGLSPTMALRNLGWITSSILIKSSIAAHPPIWTEFYGHIQLLN